MFQSSYFTLWLLTLNWICHLPAWRETSKQWRESWLIHLKEHTLAQLFFRVLYGAIPGHLYSFLACAISPLLKRVRWPIAGRMPLSSREGRIVSRNIPLKKIRNKPHISHQIKTNISLTTVRLFFSSSSQSKGKYINVEL